MKLYSAFLALLFAQVAFASNPVISFFNEQEGKDLQALFSDTTLIPSLQKMNAEIRMGMLDLSEERIEVLKQLNNANIPVVAWLLLSKEDGYFFHSGNPERATERYHEIKNWAEANDIRFDGIGIDLEIDLTEIDLIENDKFKLIRRVFGRLYEKDEFLESKRKYEKLISEIRSDGFAIESYYMPFFNKESEEGRTALQQATRLMDLKTDKDIPMLYSSFIGNPYGLLKVLAIDKNLKYIAIGSTGGGIDPTMPKMSWDDLSYDIKLASKTAQEIHIFCLEATVEQGFIPKLIGFDFNSPFKEFPEQIISVQKIEKRIMQLSKILSYPTLLILSILLIIILLLYIIFKFTRMLFRKFSRN